MTMQIFSYFSVVYDWNHYFGLGQIPKLKLADDFGQYRKWYRNHISKRESSNTDSIKVVPEGWAVIVYCYTVAAQPSGTTLFCIV